jgi:single-strand DNA-binding protein
MNVFSFSGNLGRDGATNNVGGTAVLNFAVGVKSGYGDKEQTVWVDCALWGKQAESRLVEYMVKGQRVTVSGELGTREYQANDGTTRTAITCRVNQIGLEGSAQAGGYQQGGQQAPRQQQQPAQQQQQTPQHNLQQNQAAQQHQSSQRQPPPGNQPMGVQQPQQPQDDYDPDSIPF